MYAVIRTGGKQYRVAPGDVIRVERTPAAHGKVDFSEVLAVSTSEGSITRPEKDARVTGHVLEEGRGDKVLVFHFKRKKQYKKLAGHRQPFTRVRITEIACNGQSFKAAESDAHAPAKAKAHRVEARETKHEKHAAPKSEHHEKAAHKKPAAKTSLKKKK